MRKRGFTFIEILIVVILIGILTAFSLPKFQSTFRNLQLSSFSYQLQTLMIYLCERSIIEGKTILVVIDNEKREILAQIKTKDLEAKLKTYRIPGDITMESDQQRILFYPDGQIDKVTIKLTNPDGQNITLTTKGVYGRIKRQEG